MESKWCGLLTTLRVLSVLTVQESRICSFVLGVQSRHLRSSHLKELVFRKDADSAQTRKASVKLIYRLSENEIAGRAEGSELAFSRSISAAGVSSYRLDNKDVSYERYEETLQSIGVLVKARNFLVFQGDVETVAAKSPQDLTKLLTQISGSDQFIEEYNELLRLKTEAEDKMIFGMQKKKMYSTQCREVKEQKDEAEYFQGKKHELAELYTDYKLFHIWTIKSEQEAKQDNADELREQLETIKQTGFQEKSYASVHAQLDSVTPKLNETRAKMKSLQKRLAEQERAKSRVQKDIADQQDKVTGLQNDIAELESAEEHTRLQIEKAADSGLKLNSADMKEYTSLRERERGLARRNLHLSAPGQHRGQACRLRSFGQKYKLCVDVLECEDIYKPAVSHAVGSTLVCDTLQNAQDLCFTSNERVKVVTLKNTMTGVASGTSSNSDRWEAREGAIL
eukprot:gene8621-10210_t